MDKEQIKQKIVKALDKLELVDCPVCGEPVPTDELEALDGACDACWKK